MAEFDEEKLHFDVIVLGTGLIESLISCTASKEGKRVLHMDANDYYGDSFSANNLSSFLKEYSLSSNLEAPCSSALSRNKYVLMNNYIPKAKEEKKPFQEPIETTENSSEVAQVSEITEQLSKEQEISNKQAKLLEKDREFNIDVSPKVIIGSGTFIDGMINSGVNRYVDFKANEAVYFLSPDNGKFWKVPCTKNDIFLTNDLSALEKRVVMKFMQMINDQSKTSLVEDVRTLNEVELASGRSLHRPQNKGVLQEEIPKEDLEAPFIQLLEKFKLSPKLQSLIVHGVCFKSDPLSTLKETNSIQGIIDLAMVIECLGKYGETPYLLPVYGMNEIVQGFCRMSAVWGGIFILRSEIDKIDIVPSSELPSEPIKTTKLEGAEEDLDQKPTSPSKLVQKDEEVIKITDKEGKIYTANHLVSNFLYNPTSSCSNELSLHVIVITSRPVLPTERSLGIIPPFYKFKDSLKSSIIELNNKYSIHIIQSDESTGSSPQSTYVTHLVTRIDDFGYTNENQAISNWFKRVDEFKDTYNTFVNTLIASLFSTGTIMESDIIFQNAFLRPIANLSSNSSSDKIIYTPSWSSKSIHLDEDMKEALHIYNRCFNSELKALFPPAEPEIDDLEEQDVNEYQEILTMAKDLEPSTNIDTQPQVIESTVEISEVTDSQPTENTITSELPSPPSQE